MFERIIREQSANDDFFLLSIKSNLRKLASLNSSVFISGDFNAKHRYWHNSANNANGNNLFIFFFFY